MPYPTPSTASQLTADFVYANSNAGSYTITLAANTPFNFTSADNGTNGANALPVLTGNITIVGNGDTLNGSNAVRLFDVASSGSLSLENLTLTGGLAFGTGAAAEGGAIYSSGTLTLSGVTVRSNTAQASNGAKGKGTAAGSNGANAEGGGLYVASGSVTLTNDTLSANDAQGGTGGAGSIGGRGGAGGTGAGGGMYVAAGTVILTNDVLSGNNARGGIGGVGGDGGTGGKGRPSSLGIGGGGGTGVGGGLYVGGGSFSLSNNTFRTNAALGGKGGNGGSNAAQVGCIAGGGGNGSGGGLYLVSTGTSTSTNDTFSTNNAQGGNSGNGGNGGRGLTNAGGLGAGGGIVVGGGTVILTNDTFSANTGGAYGGGIENGGSLTVSNSTLFGNTAQYGGGIENVGNLTVSDSTLSGNAAQYGGGILNVASPTNVLLHNSLIAGNQSGGNPSDISNLFGSLNSLNSASDYNLIGDGSGGLSTANHNLLGSSSHLLNPLLAPLGNYGGPTQTMALLPGSPAIDAGSSVYGSSTDQRGEPRSGATDIGAFESQGFTVAVGSGNNQNAFANTTFADPLVVSVTANNPTEPVSGGSITFTAPASGASAVLGGSPATIGSDGTASVTAAANSAPGAYVVTASAPGVASPVNFSLNNISTAVFYTVTSAADDGSAGTLRDAINQVNAGKYDAIDFNIAGTGVQTINLTSALPAITASGVFINGPSENQFQGVTSTSPLIELNGSGAGSSSDGLLLQGSSCMVSGLLIEDFTNGIEVDGTGDTIGGAVAGAGNILSGNSKDGVLIDSGISGVQVQGNYIGTDVTGSAALANSIGIEVAGNNNTIGSTTFSGARNIISGNSADGVLIDGGISGVQVQGNYIGTDVTGTTAVANSIGVEVAGGNNTIGGTTSGARNVITGHHSDGVLIDSGVSGVQVQGNYIGTNAAGTGYVGNALDVQLYGVYVEGPNNTIGGTSAAARNIISGDDTGVHIDTSASGVLVQGNYIGLDVSGSNAVFTTDCIEVEGPNNTIGGTATGARNIISGYYAGYGLAIGSAASGVLVQGNYIGTDATGENNVGGYTGIVDSGSDGTIGGTSAAARNIISCNNYGVEIYGSGVSVQGNYIGTDVTGGNNGNFFDSEAGVLVDGSNNTIGGSVAGAGNLIAHSGTGAVQVDTGTGDTIRLNSITNNYGNGITLSNGGNNNLAAPSLGSATLANDTLTVKASFYSPSADTTYVLDFFANPSNDAEGKVYLGSLTVTSTSTGTQSITFTTTTTVTATNPLITATLTDSSGDTSAFSVGVMDPMTNYVVTSSADDGSVGTLRDAINQANAAGSSITEIDFHIGSSGSAQTINLTSQLPTLTASGAYINGLSQGGSGNITQMITLNGTRAGSSSDGLLLQGSNCTVSGLIIEHFGNNGIEVAGSGNTIGGSTQGARDVISRNGKAGVLIDSGSSGNQVLGNYIGTNAAGSSALANQVGIEDAGSGNTLGGSVLGARNIISGNSDDGILLDSSATGETVQGNFLGLDSSGKTALANGNNGVEVQGSNNTIGGNSGSNYYVRNFLSGNTGDGLLIDSGATGNQVLGNFIGLDLSGTHGVGNLNGIEVAGNSNTFGATSAFGTNYISGNNNDGILLDGTASANLIQGTDVGTDYAGRAAVGNSGSGIEVMGNGNTLGGTTTAARNIISGNSLDGVRIDSGASGTLIQGNFIGLNAIDAAVPNAGNGINLGGTNNIIGGTALGTRNYISGNGKDGVLLGSSASGNVVLGNFLGVNLFSNAAANNNGIEVAGTQNTVGGSASGSFNVISSNKNDGVMLDATASGNVVLGNSVGLNVYGNIAVGNSIGIEVAGHNNTVGASYAVAPNVISGNSKDGVRIDSGASGNQVLGNYIGTNHAGTAAMANQVGIEDGGSGNTIGGSVLGARNVLSGNSGDGVLLDSSATEETVQGNYIGLNNNGKSALANGSNGVEVQGNNNLIGGNSGSNYFTRNFISGNTGDGLLIANGATGNVVQGNFIGLDVSGTNGVSNSIGIEVAGNRNTLGGASFGLGNVLSGNSSDGLRLDSLATNNVVQRNDVGTDYTGTSAVSNGGNGVTIVGNNNTLGGSTAAAGNIIAHNGGDGVLVSVGVGNTITSNSIFANAALGIALSNGGNNTLAAPNLLTATLIGSTLTVTGSFPAPTANVSYVLQFFANLSGDPEGKVYLGSLTVTPTTTGTQLFTFTTTTTVTGTYPLITATLTDATADTSAFSSGVTT